MARRQYNKRVVGGLDQKVLDIRRVARVVAGGKRFSFRATVVVGNHGGRVGVGVAKGKDVSQSIDKAVEAAKKQMIDVPIVHGTIPHEVWAKHSSARVLLRPAKSGRGIIAGGSMRSVMSLAGIKDVSAKILGRTPNKLTNAMATIEALKKLKKPGIGK